MHSRHAGEKEQNPSFILDTESYQESNGIAPLYSLSRPHFHLKALKEHTATLAASDDKDPQILCIPDDTGEYDMRRSTEKEYAILQGFPEDYCDDLVYNDVSDEDMIFWRKVWDEWCEANGKKLKTDKQIERWLKTKPAKSAEYRMWGNGVALPIPEYILGKIKEVETNIV